MVGGAPNPRGGRVDHGAGPEDEAERFGERLQTVQRLGVDQPQQVAAFLHDTV